MSQSRPKLTPTLQARICNWIRRGGYPQVAAEAAGIPRAVFESWMEKGSQSNSRKIYRELVQEVEKAHAEARLAAELKTYVEEPLIWLRTGPGKETLLSRGWTTSASLRFSDVDLTISRLLHQETQELLQRLMKAFGDEPATRKKLAQILTKN